MLYSKSSDTRKILLASTITNQKSDDAWTQGAVGDANVIHEGGCRVYLGKVGSLQTRLYVKGRGDFQRSKRRSIIAFYDILGERIASGKSEEPLAVLHMDADTGSAEPGRYSFSGKNVQSMYCCYTSIWSCPRTALLAPTCCAFSCTRKYIVL